MTLSTQINSEISFVTRILISMLKYSNQFWDLFSHSNSNLNDPRGNIMTVRIIHRSETSWWECSTTQKCHDGLYKLSGTVKGRGGTMKWTMWNARTWLSVPTIWHFPRFQAVHITQSWGSEGWIMLTTYRLNMEV